MAAHQISPQTGSLGAGRGENAPLDLGARFPGNLYRAIHPRIIPRGKNLDKSTSRLGWKPGGRLGPIKTNRKPLYPTPEGDC